MKKSFDQIDHNLVILSDEEKFPYLLKSLREKSESKTLIFCNGPFNIELISQWLGKADIQTAKFANKASLDDSKVVICDDSSLKKLENTEVDYVINYELPKRTTNYLERISKAKLKDDQGYAISLCGYKDCENLDAIEDQFNLKIAREYIEDGDLDFTVPSRPELDPSAFKRNKRDKRDSRNPRDKKEAKTKRENKPREANTPQKPKPKKIEKFTISTNSEDEAYSKAMEHFKLEDKSKLHANILSEGPKKFVFFGSQEVTYEFTYSSGYRSDIEPFLKTLLEMMKVDLTYRIEEDPKNFTIHLEGEDLGLVLNNRKQVMFAIDALVRQFVIKRVDMPRNIKVSVRAQGTHQRERKPRTNNRPNKRGNSRYNRSDRPRKEVDEKGLNDLAQNLKEQVMETGAPQCTETLHPAERRIIHQFFEGSNFTTNSIGDGRFKKVEISILNQ